jgi:hypothetical protein
MMRNSAYCSTCLPLLLGQSSWEGRREVWEKENELELQDRGKMASFEEI